MAFPLVLGIPPAIEAVLMWLGIGIVAGGSVVVIAENMNEANKSAGSSQSGTSSYVDACASCMPPPEDDDGDDGEDDYDDDEKDGRDAKRVSNNKEADRIARDNGFKDAHDLKRSFNLNSRSDLFVGRSGRVYSGAHNGRGAREWLGIYRN